MNICYLLVIRSLLIDVAMLITHSSDNNKLQFQPFCLELILFFVCLFCLFVCFLLFFCKLFPGAKKKSSQLKKLGHPWTIVWGSEEILEDTEGINSDEKK